MKHLLALVLALPIFFVISCKSSTTEPTDTSKGLVTDVGTPVGSPITATIDATGGSLTSADGRFELVVPANALSAPTSISIQPVTNKTPQGTGLAYSLTPHGQVFAQPVTLRFHYTAEDLLGSDANALGVATQKDDRIWYAYESKTIDTAAKTVTVESKTFSVKSLYQILKIVPDEETIKINGTLDVTVKIVEHLESDDVPDDLLAPLPAIKTYPNAEEITFTLNGQPLGSVEDGFFEDFGNFATYHAPSSTKDMTSNPVAMAATVDILGPAKYYLISNITVTSEPGIQGNIILTVLLNDTRSYNGGAIEEVKTETGEASITYDLPNLKIENGGGGYKFGSWNEAGFNGTSSQTSEHTRTYDLLCNSGKVTVTDIDKTVTTYAGGKQVTGMSISINPDGTYLIMAGPPTNLTAASSKTITVRNPCDVPQMKDSTMSSLPIPFASYFLPMVAGDEKKMSGKIDPAHPHTLSGIYNGVDSLTLFSYNSQTIKIPVYYKLKWDLTLTE